MGTYGATNSGFQQGFGAGAGGDSATSAAAPSPSRAAPSPSRATPSPSPAIPSPSRAAPSLARGPAGPACAVRAPAGHRCPNYPSALIRQPSRGGEGRQGGSGAAERRSRSRSRSGADACLRRPRGARRWGGGPAAPLVPSGGVALGQALLSRVPLGSAPHGVWLAQGRVFISSGNTGLTRAHPGPACLSLSSPSAKPVPFPNPAWKMGLTPSPSIICTSGYASARRWLPVAAVPVAAVPVAAVPSPAREAVLGTGCP